MIENAAACIILQARQSKYYVTFTDKEFEFVSSHPALRPNEKLIWFNLVRKSLRDHNLSCAITHQQIATMVGIKQDTAYRAVKKLRRLGFLEAQFDTELQIVTYSITLPEEGLEAITNAPNRGEKGREPYTHVGQKSDTPPDKNPVPSGQKSGPPPDKNPILLINNNNKHNNHKQPQRQQALIKTVNDADALVCEFESLLKEFKDLPVRERVRRVNAHFSPEENCTILAHIQKTAPSNAQNRNTTPATPLKNPTPPSRRPSLMEKTKLIEFEFDNATFLLEEAVKNKIVHGLSLLHRQGKIKGEASQKPCKAIMKEVLFYVANAGKMTNEPVIQLKRYHIACKLLQKGVWERPKRMVLDEVTAKEKLWQAAKSNEIEKSRFVFSTAGSL